MGKIAPSTTEASTRRCAAVWAISLSMARRRHSWSATDAEPMGRESSTFMSKDGFAATASAESRKRLIERRDA